MALSKERKGEIALLLLKARLTEKGITLHPETLPRELGNAAKNIGVPLEEVMEVVEEIAREVFEETFKKTKK